MSAELSAHRVAAVLRKAGLKAYKPPRGAYTSVRGKTLYDTSAEEGCQCKGTYDGVRVDYITTRGSWTDDQAMLRQMSTILEGAGFCVRPYCHSGRIVCLDVTLPSEV